MIQEGLNNMYIDIGANNGSDKLCTQKETMRLPVSQLKQYMLRTSILITQLYTGATQTADQAALRHLMYVPHNLKGKVKKKKPSIEVWFYLALIY